MIELPIKCNLIFSKKWEGKISSFEIEPVKSETDDDNDKFATICDESEAEAFGVYARMDDGLAEWMADFETKEAAEAFVELIKYAASLYNGMPDNPNGLIYLQSVDCFYSQILGCTYQYNRLSIDDLNPTSLDEIENSDWFRMLSDADWNNICTGKYSNLKEYNSLDIADFVNDHFNEILLTDIIPKTEANPDKHSNFLTFDNNLIYYKVA